MKTRTNDTMYLISSTETSWSVRKLVGLNFVHIATNKPNDFFDSLPLPLQRCITKGITSHGNIYQLCDEDLTEARRVPFPGKEPVESLDELAVDTAKSEMWVKADNARRDAAIAEALASGDTEIGG